MRTDTTLSMGDTDRPATQRELAEAQLEAQSQLFDQVASVKQEMNDGLGQINNKLIEVIERIAHIEGENDATQAAQSQGNSNRSILVLTLGLIFSFCFSLASLIWNITH